jgi:hypothetical protein
MKERKNNKDKNTIFDLFKGLFYSTHSIFHQALAKQLKKIRKYTSNFEDIVRQQSTIQIYIKI